jgi:signal transduction histidine kinase
MPLKTDSFTYDYYQTLDPGMLLMPEVSTQLIPGSVAAIFVLLLLGIFFLLMLLYNLTKRQQLEKENKALKVEFEKQLLQSQIEIQEQTFNTISQEIHDNIGQMLGLAKVQINIMDQSESINKEQLKELRETIGIAMSDLRDIAHSLDTERIQSFNLSDMICSQADRINRGGFVQISVVVEGTEQRLENHSKLILFRIVQESLQNIIKHSKATRVMLGFCYTTQLHITISDDGIGFDTFTERQKKTGIGLQNIIKRASMAGGTASVSSAIGKGTTIKITMPYA